MILCRVPREWVSNLKAGCETTFQPDRFLTAAALVIPILGRDRTRALASQGAVAW